MTSVDVTKTAPWSTDTHDLLTRSMSHIARARVVLPTGEVFPLDLEDGDVTFDETRAPRAQTTLSCKVPTDQALLDRLDPRTGGRLVIDAGYRRPDQTEDVQRLVDLGLRSRKVSRPADTMAMVGMSDEALLVDGAGTIGGTITNATTTGAITAVINQRLTTTPTVAGSAGPAVSAVLFEDRWDVINDLADRIGAQVYDDGLRNWVIAPAPTLSAPALSMTTGPGGTVLASSTGLDRDDGFANQVWLRYEWLNGTTTNRVNSVRRITTGPYAAVLGNYKTLRVERAVATTQTEADAAAAALVARTVTRGRSFEIDAVSAYWLRPGMTVTVKLPIGDAEDHLVTAVSFDLRAGTMRVTTRLPDGSYTIAA